MTAAIGILVGIGFWFAALVGAVATLMVLALFRLIEASLTSENAERLSEHLRGLSEVVEFRITPTGD